MKDELNDLILWLEKLLENLAKANPDDGREEVERRSQLARFVSCLTSLAHIDQIPYRLLEIRTRSLTLSEKGKVARLLDKTRFTRSDQTCGKTQASYSHPPGQCQRPSESEMIDTLDRYLNDSQYTIKSFT